MKPNHANRTRRGATDRRSGPRRAEIRELREPGEFTACVELQKATWGEEFTELVPASLLLLTRQNGGVVAGAFDGDRLLGFVLGFTAVQDGAVAHWSHMLAVGSEARGRGLGLRLKLFQRSLLLQRDIDLAFWTYDPLVSRNAHLNLNRLGAEVVEYVEDMYGTDTHSRLHGGAGTDRFLVRWDLSGPRARSALEHRHLGELPPSLRAAVVLDEGDGGEAGIRDPERRGGGDVLIEVPADFTALLARSPELASRWRQASRRAFRRHLDRGYRVAGFGRRPPDDRYFYLLEAP